jgi:hypothetical protein
VKKQTMSTFDAEEQKRRIAEAKKRILEAIDFIDSWEEIEAKKRSATETPIQD